MFHPGSMLNLKPWILTHYVPIYFQCYPKMNPDFSQWDMTLPYFTLHLDESHSHISESMRLNYGNYSYNVGPPGYSLVYKPQQLVRYHYHTPYSSWSYVRQLSYHQRGPHGPHWIQKKWVTFRSPPRHIMKSDQGSRAPKP